MSGGRCLQEAQKILDGIKKEVKSVSRELNDTYKALSETLGNNLLRADRENATVYLQRIPQFLDLPPIAPAALVKPIPPALDAARDGLFTSVIPDGRWDCPPAAAQRPPATLASLLSPGLRPQCAGWARSGLGAVGGTRLRASRFPCCCLQCQGAQQVHGDGGQPHQAADGRAGGCQRRRTRQAAGVGAARVPAGLLSVPGCWHLLECTDRTQCSC